jgi:hypothetical protein
MTGDQLASTMLTMTPSGTPLDVQSFIDSFWSQDIFIGKCASALFEEIAGSDDFELLLSEDRLYQVADCIFRSSMRESRRIRDVAGAAEGLSTGWSIQARHAERVLPRHHPLRQLAEAFVVLTGCPLHSFNLFAAPPAVRGFAPHHDPDHILTFQIKGTKQWRIQKEGSAIVESDVEFTLEPGHLLYMPPQTVHTALSLDEPSLSISLAFNPPRYDLFWEYLAAEPSISSMLASTIPGRVSSPYLEKLAGEVSPFIDSVRTRFAEISAEGFAQYILARHRGVEPVRRRVRFSDFERAPPCLFVTAPDLEISVSEEEGKVVIGLPGDLQFKAPERVEGELRWILERRERFCARDVPTRLSHQSIVILLQKLLHAGVLKAAE